MSMKILIILGSTRPNRESEKVGPWVLREIQKRPEFEAELIDLRDWPLPFYNEVAGRKVLRAITPWKLLKNGQSKSLLRMGL